MSEPTLNTRGLRLWAVVNAGTGALRCRAVPDTAFDWQGKIYTSKKIALKYAWPNEYVIPVSIQERPGRKVRGK